MLNLLMFIIASLVGFFMYLTYKPKSEKELADEKSRMRSLNTKFKRTSLFSVLGLPVEEISTFHVFLDHFNSFTEISYFMAKAGLTKCNLIIGVDFTASNEWQGRRTFGGHSLHLLTGSKVRNPYQKVIAILGETLEPFSQDFYVPAYGFGDSLTQDTAVFSFSSDNEPCKGFKDVLKHYNDVVKRVILSGPTSYAPLINKAIEIVKEKEAYHILVIIADGQVTSTDPTIDAIVEASQYALSIVMVGVGDGPWDMMEEFDNRLPQRKFDNFQFVNFHEAIRKGKNPETAFALQALMEIPDQYKAICELGYFKNKNHLIYQS